MDASRSRAAAHVRDIERWIDALDRAEAQGVTVRQLAGSGAWIATSGSDPLAAYVVSIRDCECHAAAHGNPICKHRAALRAHLGIPLAPLGGLWSDVPAEELVSLKAAAYRDYLAGGPLVNPITGELIADAL